MLLRFLGATRTVTGSCFLLETPAGKLMVDFGMYQGPRHLRELNSQPLVRDLSDVNWLILTHGHIDHIGLVPRLRKQGFSGRIICTRATADLCAILLPDSAHIQEEDAKWEEKRRRKGKPAGPPVEPLYTVEDAEAILEAIEGYGYKEPLRLERGLTVRFEDAGHILGSAIAEVTVATEGGERKVVFSGDLGNTGQPILRDATPVDAADAVLIESTYGYRLHEDNIEKAELLREVVNRTAARKGRLIIPSFSVGRSQELVYEFDKMVRENSIPRLPVFLDSPLSAAATDIFKRHPECYDEEMAQLIRRGETPLEFPGLKITQTVEESKRINEYKGPCVIISASGMCTAGRILHHLSNNIGDERNTVLFVGFQAEGTLGRKIHEGEEYVYIFGEKRRVRARVRSIGGFSAHADQRGLLAWLSAIEKAPEFTFCIHGEEKSSMAFCKRVIEDLGLRAYVPEMGEAVNLLDGDAYRRKVRQQAPVLDEFEARLEAERAAEKAPPVPAAVEVGARRAEAPVQEPAAVPTAPAEPVAAAVAGADRRDVLSHLGGVIRRVLGLED